MRGSVVRIGVAAVIALAAGTGSSTLAATNRPAAPKPAVSSVQCQTADYPVGHSRLCAFTDQNAPVGGLTDFSKVSMSNSTIFWFGYLGIGRDSYGPYRLTGVSADRELLLLTPAGFTFIGAAASAGQSRYQQGKTKTSFTGVGAGLDVGSFGATPFSISVGADAGEYATNRGCNYVAGIFVEANGQGTSQTPSVPCVAPRLPPLAAPK